jgi:hypothetical protein
MTETGKSATASDGDDGPGDIAPIDVQRLLTWYFDFLHPGRHHIASRHRYSLIIV